MDWYALRIEPMREFVVETILKDKGFRVFVPTEVKHKRVGLRRKRVPHDYPMLPRYLFVAALPEMPWHALLWQRGVQGVISRNGEPARIAQAAIDRLASVSGKQLPTRATSVHRSFVAGDKVEITAGAYKGFLVPIESISGKAATLLIPMFGATMAATIPLEHLEAA